MTTKISKVQAYFTTDGELFRDAGEAAKHQAEVDFDQHYLANYCLGNFEGSRVELADMKKYLLDNKEIIINFLRGR